MDLSDEEKNKQNKKDIKQHEQGYILPMQKGEQTELLPKTKRQQYKDSILLKTLSFGMSGLFITAHLVLNGKYLSLLGQEGASASALVTPYESVVMGLGIGFLLGTGLNFGDALGRNAYTEAGDIGKTATVLTLIMGGISASLMLLTKPIFPLLFEKVTAEIASDFFMGYSGSLVSTFLLFTWSQIAFQEGDLYVSPLSMLLLSSFSAAASYCLGFKADKGALGIGLGGTIGSMLSALTIGALFFQKHYKKYRFINCHIEKFTEKLMALLKSGWKLALQRLSEWGNLFIISTVVGVHSNTDLKALNPSILFLVSLGTILQGFAQSTGMVISKNKGGIKKIINKEINEENVVVPKKNIFSMDELSVIENNHKNNIRAIVHSNLLGIALTSTIATTIYFARRPISTFLLSADSSEELVDLAEYLLCWNVLALVPDSLRIIAAGALRGWGQEELLYPTIISLILMTVIGIPLAYGLGDLFSDEVSMMAYVRLIAIAISSVFIFKRCHSKIKNDEITQLNEYITSPSFFKTGFSLGSGKNKETDGKIIGIVKNKEDDEDESIRKESNHVIN